MRRSLLLRRKVEDSLEERALLEARIAELEGEARRIYANYAEAAAQSAHFAHLFLTVQRLRAARGREGIYEAIRELVENLVGSSEVAIYERREAHGDEHREGCGELLAGPRGEAGAALQLGASFGVEPEPPGSISLGAGIVGQVVATGQAYFAEHTGEGAEGEVTACIPLAFEHRILGAVVIYRMLPQKPALSRLDHEILSVLVSHAAVALAEQRRDIRTAARVSCEPGALWRGGSLGGVGSMGIEEEAGT
ncbi:GAF domain-containing protein [Chondromyces apiculatus]|uniref:GAF domain protein n=1 Tax=Chondromyces apiculatus DSM 436 TaxID=1192034 RepID=A0A017T176_9BACT|nr:GAF domain-containing protein [Chondromyces apiculatus]EYF02565.1 GAF domain protein [Chondromyces apiculatus DSM 436]